MEHLIASDAETETFKDGAIKMLPECPADFQANFNTAREAIVQNDIDELKNAVAKMKENKDVDSDQCLNVCVTLSKYPMTLLALAGSYARSDMVIFLLSPEAGADIDMGNKECGSPLLQMMAYAPIKKREDNLSSAGIDASIVNLFIKNRAVLSRVSNVEDCENVTALELAINNDRLDIIKLLLDAGADPILCGDGVISPLFIEYTLFGSHKFIKWLLNDYLDQSIIPAFINRILETGVLFRDEMKKKVYDTYYKHPAHAFLLCGHKQFIECLVDKRPELTQETDPYGKLALHIAAEEGDLISVKILLDCESPINAKDGNSMTPLMRAAANGHEEVVEAIANKVVITENKHEIFLELCTWALQHGYTAYFEAMHATPELEEFLLSRAFSNGNTITHFAAEGNLVSVFKATFLRTKDKKDVDCYEILTTENGSNKTPLQLAIENGNIRILTALEGRINDRGKKAYKTNELFLKLAVAREKGKWKDFWDRESPGLLHYACSCGTVETVKFFIARLVSPTRRYKKKISPSSLSEEASLSSPSEETPAEIKTPLEMESMETPLSAAAKAGKHEIVAYLLNIRGVSAEGVATDKVQTLSEVEKQFSPLMLASKHGHAKCVQLLLEKEADIRVVSDRGYNCLMEAIERGHKSAVIILLEHTAWKDLMCHCVAEGARKKADDGENKNKRLITPMRMLIEYMPGVVKIALSRCIKPPSEICSEVVYDFEFIEDYVQPPPDPQPSHYPLSAPVSEETAADNSDFVPEIENRRRRNEFGPLMKKYIPLDHPISLLVKHERLDLLKHPLIRRYINNKWWKVSFPVFLTVLSLYVLFLIFLVSFSLVIPRPGPQSTYCPSNETTDGYTQDNLEDGVCKDPDEMDQHTLSALAIILIIMSIAFLIYEIVFYYLMKGTRKISDCIQLVYRIVMYFLAIVFVFGFVNDCWCAPPWQWQIGALVLFMAFFNLILLLKGMPWFGVPINMLLNVIMVFLKLVYLPILLILSFAFAFYMLFVRKEAEVLISFSTILHSLAKVFVQTAGELDYSTLFEEASLLYTPMAFILFVIFVVLMPILFNNLLVGLAVGTAEEDTKKAELTNICLQVEYIVQLEKLAVVHRMAHLPNLKYSKENSKNCVWTWIDKIRGADYETQAELVQELLNESNKGSKEGIEEIKDKVTEMAARMSSLQLSISTLKKSQTHLHEKVEVIMEKSLEPRQQKVEGVHV